MSDMETVSVRVEKSGRILIPVAIRRRLGLKDGESDVLLGIADTQPVVVSTRAQALERAQAILSRYAGSNRQPGGTLISEELIAERKEEARWESEP